MDNQKETDGAASQPGAEGISLEEFRAELDVFSGPLDLLLHLIQREELDILDIPISSITDSYLSAMKAMQMFDINIAGEFLVMAATLMDIKSRSLLPDPIFEEEEDDPKDELIHQLLEYKRFKQIAVRLEDMAAAQAATFPRRPPPEETEPGEIEVETLLSDIDIWDCVSAYAEVIRQIEMSGAQRIVYDEVPVAQYMEEITGTLSREGGEKDFLTFFRHDRSRPRVIGIFLALLELLRQGEVRIVQKEGEKARIAVGAAPAGKERDEAGHGRTRTDTDELRPTDTDSAP